LSTLSRMAYAIAACCCTSVAGAADLQTVVDQAIKPIMKEYDVPGIAVAVTVNGKPAFFSYGLASKETGTPVSETTLFELGSVSKTFTATVASYALAQGKLSLDDHPSRYVPKLKGTALDKATVLNFGTYTAGGLPLQFPDSVTDDEAGMLAYYGKFKPKAAPGKIREYSNPSLGMFGYLAGLALKSNPEDVLEKDILPKLGMNGTYIRMPAKRGRQLRLGLQPGEQGGAHGARAVLGADLWCAFQRVGHDPLRAGEYRSWPSGCDAAPRD